jgi:hypothetical protein
MAAYSSHKNKLVIPQKGAGKRFGKLITTYTIHQVNLVTANGKSLINLPVQINFRNIIPGVFRIPIQAIVYVLSIPVRIARLHIVIEYDGDNGE